ncbi:hypothetical protein GPJ56_007485 [Histomonas meleagridis]|uniref:uncharacterized protein n=1 Tax=Histomonas meleagridis TaxID=135588 RepID=UPI00355A6F95|nr:hypothetical protein GPJ56_007485 [Histomonas meleagridis]KAH0804331.1 hypothetical protein GO595_003161 [Histomonas meleagridis]
MCLSVIIKAFSERDIEFSYPNPRYRWYYFLNPTFTQKEIENCLKEINEYTKDIKIDESRQIVSMETMHSWQIFPLEIDESEEPTLAPPPPLLIFDGMPEDTFTDLWNYFEPLYPPPDEPILDEISNTFVGNINMDNVNLYSNNNMKMNRIVDQRNFFDKLRSETIHKELQKEEKVSEKIEINNNEKPEVRENVSISEFMKPRAKRRALLPSIDDEEEEQNEIETVSQKDNNEEINQFDNIETVSQKDNNEEINQFDNIKTLQKDNNEEINQFDNIETLQKDNNEEINQINVLSQSDAIEPELESELESLSDDNIEESEFLHKFKMFIGYEHLNEENVNENIQILMFIKDEIKNLIKGGNEYTKNDNNKIYKYMSKCKNEKEYGKFVHKLIELYKKFFKVSKDKNRTKSKVQKKTKKEEKLYKKEKEFTNEIKEKNSHKTKNEKEKQKDNSQIKNKTKEKRESPTERWNYLQRNEQNKNAKKFIQENERVIKEDKTLLENIIRQEENNFRKNEKIKQKENERVIKEDKTSRENIIKQEENNFRKNEKIKQKENNLRKNEKVIKEENENKEKIIQKDENNLRENGNIIKEENNLLKNEKIIQKEEEKEQKQKIAKAEESGKLVPNEEIPHKYSQSETNDKNEQIETTNHKNEINANVQNEEKSQTNENTEESDDEIDMLIIPKVRRRRRPNR